MSSANLQVGDFAVQYSNLDATEIAASGYDLVIVEGQPLLSANAELLDLEVAALVGGGQEVIGYVSIGQTDDARPYWNPLWTDDGTDTGTPTILAPTWLAEPADSFAAFMVEFWDPAWKALVIAQVTELATRGYSGIFLDNVLTYYELAVKRGVDAPTAQTYAQEMITFIEEIAAAGRAIDPDFKVIANGGPYIVTDAGYAFGDADALSYFEAIDAIMGESFFGLVNGLRQEAILDLLEQQYAAAGIDVLALEYSTDPAAIQAFVDEAAARGFAASASPSLALDSLPDPVAPTPPAETGVDWTGTPDADVRSGTDFDDLMHGLGGADDLSGAAGDDQIWGQGGEDTLSGGGGDDTLSGGAGDDTLSGGDGFDLLRGGGARDRLIGGDKDDVLYGQDGADTLSGGRGDDSLFGGKGRDVLNGGNGDDVMTGGIGADTFVFDHRGRNVITDFDTDVDIVALRGNDEVNARAVKAGLRLDFDDGSILLLEDIGIGQLEDITFTFG